MKNYKECVGLGAAIAAVGIRGYFRCPLSREVETGKMIARRYYAALERFGGPEDTCRIDGDAIYSISPSGWVSEEPAYVRVSPVIGRLTMLLQFWRELP